jgi:hypothetical protein
MLSHCTKKIAINEKRYIFRTGYWIAVLSSAVRPGPKGFKRDWSKLALILRAPKVALAPSSEIVTA